MFSSIEIVPHTPGKPVTAKTQVSVTYFLMFGMAALFAPAASWAGDDSGKGFASVSELTGAWWNWALAGPPDENPVVDEDGRNCALRQHGKIWFLAGNFGGPPITRYCRIPAGKTLFFPLFNALWWTPEDAPTLEEIRALANGQVADPAIVGDLELSLTVDGVPLADPFAYRAQSPPGGFAFKVLPGSMAELGFGITPGTRDPAVADGYWVLLKKLGPGHHTIRIVTSAFGGGFNLDVTYELEVGPK